MFFSLLLLLRISCWAPAHWARPHHTLHPQDGEVHHSRPQLKPIRILVSLKKSSRKSHKIANVYKYTYFFHVFFTSWDQNYPSLQSHSLLTTLYLDTTGTLGTSRWSQLTSVASTVAQRSSSARLIAPVTSNPDDSATMIFTEMFIRVRIIEQLKRHETTWNDLLDPFKAEFCDLSLQALCTAMDGPAKSLSIATNTEHHWTMLGITWFALLRDPKICHKKRSCLDLGHCRGSDQMQCKASS